MTVKAIKMPLPCSKTLTVEEVSEAGRGGRDATVYYLTVTSAGAVHYQVQGVTREHLAHNIAQLLNANGVYAP